MTQRKGEAKEDYLTRVNHRQHAYYRSLDPIDRIIKSSRRNAKLKSIEHTLKKEDILTPTHCPILGIALRYDVQSGRRDDSISIDRIDPTVGYTNGNTRIVSWRANRLKSDATPQELLLLGYDGFNNFHVNTQRVEIKCQQKLS